MSDAPVSAIKEEARQSTSPAQYAQIKAEEPDQLWTVATLCAKKKTVGSSLFETSLRRDKHAEIARFRIVTPRQPARALKPLTFAFGAEARAADTQEMTALAADIAQRFPQAQSPKGNGSPIGWSTATGTCETIIKASSTTTAVG